MWPYWPQQGPEQLTTIFTIKVEDFINHAFNLTQTQVYWSMKKFNIFLPSAPALVPEPLTQGP